MSQLSARLERDRSSDGPAEWETLMASISRVEVKLEDWWGSQLKEEESSLEWSGSASCLATGKK